MPREFSRRLRVAEEIKRELGHLITAKVKDPRVHLVTITDVDVSPDLKHAKVYVGMFDIANDGHQASQVLDGLTRANGFLRRELGKHLHLRVLPELRFFEDATERNAQHLSQVIHEAMDEDARRHAAADDEMSRDGDET